MTQAEILTLVIATSSLVISLVQVIYYRKEIKLIKQQYEEERTEKEKKILDISVWDSNRWTEDAKNPFKWLGIWLIVNNRSDEQPLLAEVKVELHVSMRLKDLKHEKSFLELFLSNFDERVKTVFNFSLYGLITKISSSIFSVPMNIELPGQDKFKLLKNFYLMDWETKTPLLFAHQKEIRMPAPGEKKMWLFFGSVPDENTKALSYIRFFIDEVRLPFVTDLGNIMVSKKNEIYWCTETQAKEYLGYKSIFN